MKVKKFLLLLLSVLMAFSVMSLAGCQDAPEPEVPEEPDTPDIPDTPDTPDTPPAPEEAAPLILASEGVSEYVIVRGENASPSEVTASTELQKYLKQICGAELPIVTDSTAAVEKEIVVGKTNRESEGEFDREKLGTDGFVIKTSDDKLYLVGGEKRGTLYAVYEFLESYLGCRFFTQTVETVPTLTTITIDAIKQDTFVALIILKGEGTVTTDDGEAVSVKAGDTVLIAAENSLLQVAGNMKLLETHID